MLMRFVATVNLNAARTQWPHNGGKLENLKAKHSAKSIYLYINVYESVEIHLGLAQKCKRVVIYVRLR